MSKVIAEYNDIKAVADAIRTKKNITGDMLLKDMPSNVLSIDGTDTSDATATEDDITVGTTAYTSAGLTSGANTYKKLETDAEVRSQAELIGQIVNALEGKGGGSGESDVKTCTINITSSSGRTIIDTLVLSNGRIEILHTEVTLCYASTIIENVVCGTLMYIYDSNELVPSFSHTCALYLCHPDGYTSYIVPYLENGVELTVSLEEDW